MLINQPISGSPATDGRYYLLPLLDMYSDVFAVPGWRTSGTSASHFAVVPQQWEGTLPAGVEPIDAPTSYVWIIGRTKTDGPDDYAAVHKIQDGFIVTPLSQWGQKPTAVEFKCNDSVDMETPSLEQVNGMDVAEYFGLGSALMQMHRPHITDWSIVSRMKRLGIVAGEKFDMDGLDPKAQKALGRAMADGLKLMLSKAKEQGKSVNGWAMNTDSMGVYGNFYFKRAIVSMVGLGANQPEDAIYPMNFGDAEGNPVTGDHNYVLHFGKDELPPVNAFWSITMYDQAGFACPNSINRYAISSWMPLTKNSDGSLDIYIQCANPGKDKESNWLPAGPGLLGITMRLYAPQADALNGNWNPPKIKRL
jgi:hypothetical protein